MFLQNSYCTPPTHASVATVLATVLLSPDVNAGSATILAPTGAVVSSTIVSVLSAVVFPSASLNLIYTVFVPSPVVNVCAILVLQLCRLVGFALFPYATCTPPTHASVAHTVFNVTLTHVVPTASLFIVKLHPVGAVVSRRIVLVRLLVGCNVVVSLHLIYTVFVPSHEESVCDLVAVQLCRFVGFIVFPNAISVQEGQVILVKFTFVVVVAAAPLFIWKSTTSIVIVLATGSRSIHPFAVPPSSLTLKVRVVYGAHVCHATGVYTSDGIPATPYSAFIVTGDHIYVNVPTDGNVGNLTHTKLFGGVSNGSVNPKSVLLNVCDPPAGTIILLSVPTGASFTLSTVRTKFDHAFNCPSSAITVIVVVPCAFATGVTVKLQFG